MPLIAFTSPKGGVGKTTLAAHVAAILARRGYKVLAMDLDPQNALRLHFGVSIREEDGFMARLGPRGPGWRGQPRNTASGVSLLPFGAMQPRRSLELNSTLLTNPELLGAPMREMLDDPSLVVIVDTAPGATPAASAVLPLSTLTIVLLLADAGSAPLIPQAAGARFAGRGTLGDHAADQAGVVLNQVDLDSPLSSAVLDCAVRALGTRLLGAVCRDDALAEALADKRLLTEGEGGASDDLQMLTDAIVSRAKLALPAAKWGSFPALAEWGLGQ